MPARRLLIRHARYAPAFRVRRRRRAARDALMQPQEAACAFSDAAQRCLCAPTCYTAVAAARVYTADYYALMLLTPFSPCDADGARLLPRRHAAADITRYAFDAYAMLIAALFYCHRCFRRRFASRRCYA